MTANSRRSSPGGGLSDAVFPWVLIGAVVLVVLPVWVAARAGTALSGSRAAVPADPFTLVFALAAGRIAWPGAAGWAVLAACYTAAALLATAVWAAVRRVRAGRSRVDRAAAHLGRGRDIAAQTRKQAAKTAARLGVAADAPGLPIGVTVAGGRALFSSWEDLRVTIAGTRTGKTTAIAIPQILAAPGPVVVTSNKRDVVDATRDLRAAVGKVWVFDPQGQADEPATFWWNPLSYVVDEVTAKKLAQHFATGSRPADARTDAFFDPAGQDLLAGLLLAAAADRRPIVDVYRWLTMPTDRGAIDILDQAGYPLIAQTVAGVVDAPDRQRGGVYGTARQMASALTGRAITTWITPPTHGGVPEFHPDAFIAGTGTLYSLSREGQGTAGPLVTALTVAVTEAAEKKARRSPGGRLATPLVVVLDEAANVCRWADLPDQYSHYGSRGILIDTILQSWSQGCQVWGEPGMKKLWSAANIAIYAGGVKDDRFLHMLTDLIGDHDRPDSSVSYSNGRRTTSRQTRRQRILDIDQLAALPRGRALLLASGSRPTLIKTVPWMNGPHAQAIRASIAAHDPTAAPTGDDTTVPIGGATR